MYIIVITLVTTLLSSIVSAQIPTYPQCSVFQVILDESTSSSCIVQFGAAPLDNKNPGGDKWATWEYLTDMGIAGDEGIAFASTLNFDLTTGGDPNTVVWGTVYGRSMTISNFTFITSSFLVVPKSGYYTFNIAATEGALMTITPIGDHYCCETFGDDDDDDDEEVDFGFYIANLQSEPEHNILEDSMYLLAGFRYSIGLLYLNTNGANPSLQITMTDPDGVKYDDIDPFLHRAIGVLADYCSYENVSSTTTIEWESSTTATSLKYVTSTNDANTIVVESLYVVHVPSSTPVPSSSSEIESSSITELPSSSTAASSSEFMTSSTLESSSQITSESESSTAVISSAVSTEPESSTIVISSTITSEPESSAASFSESDYSSTLTSSEVSTNEISSQPSSYSQEESSTFTTRSGSSSAIEPSGDSSEILSSIITESSTISSPESQSETVSSSGTDLTVSHSEPTSSATISSQSVTSTGDLGSSESSLLSSGNVETSSSEVTTGSSGNHENGGSSNNGDNGLQTTHYITETSVIKTTITTVCSTTTLHPDASVSSLETFTSTYVSEYTTTVTFTNCADDRCQAGNSLTNHETTKIIGEYTQDGEVTAVKTESVSINGLTTTTNGASAADSKVTSSQKPHVAVSSSESISGSTTSHSVVQNLNVGSLRSYDVLIFVISMIMSLII